MAAQLNLNKLAKFIHLHQEFSGNYIIEPAISPQLKHEALRIRHQVYCEELSWESSNRVEQERDDYDGHSLHCLLRLKASGDSIGCIRIVFPADPASAGIRESYGEVSTVGQLPFMEVCGEGLRDNFPGTDVSCAEVSRLAILENHRKSAKKVLGINFPLMATSLYMAVLHLAKVQKIEHLYILASPALVLQLKFLGVQLEQIGDAIDHKGVRIPYIIHVDMVLSEMRVCLRPMFDEVSNQINGALSRQQAPLMRSIQASNF